MSDHAGHSYGVHVQRAASPDLLYWQKSPCYLRGVDLFNHGYYWEAHEAWEALWHACHRSGATADFLKGLIKLAAAGVKARQRVPEGVRGHARRAAELFRGTTQTMAEGERRYMGLPLADLIHLAEILAS